MKKLIVFDLDGTLAESKSSLDAEMSTLLRDLLGIVKVAVISGGDWPQFEKQVLSHLPHDERLADLSLLPHVEPSSFDIPETGRRSTRKTSPWMKRKRSSVLSRKPSQPQASRSRGLGGGHRRPGKPDNLFRSGSAGPAGREGQMGPRLRQAEEDQDHP